MASSTRGDAADGDSLLACSSKELHEHVASRVEAALGQPMPQMEVRFKHLTISADMMVEDEKQTKAELPTLANVLKMAVLKASAKKHVVKKQVLYDMSGVFKPGTVTLVLGQPGSGKSSLMKLLSGRFPSTRNVTVEGEVTYNGTPQEEIRKLVPQLVSYVDQRDKHYPTLTVKETLSFAHACSGGGLSKRDEAHLVNGTTEENAAALDAARAMYKHQPEIVIKQLGLDTCQNTVVGDTMVRGVSGGERKRVTMGEMEFGSKYVVMLDEISTGLDSATTFDIITTQRSLAKQFHKTVVISLLQPSPEVFELFDDVLLLNDGRMVYHGPRDQALGYFESLGFKCPPRRDVADFLMDLGTNKQQQYEVGSAPTTAGAFADAFSRSAIHERMLEDVYSPVDPLLLRDNEQHVKHAPQFHQGFWSSTATVVTRELRVMARNTALLKSRFMISVILSVVEGLLFFQFDLANPQLVIGISFIAVEFVSLGQSALIPTLLDVRDVLYKQRRGNFFRTSSFVIASSMKQIPLGVMETLVYGSILYWMCGFAPTAEGYLLFELLLFLQNMSMAALYFFIASVSPNINVANPMAMMAILFFATFSGMLITRDVMPVYVGWIYWLSIHAWTIHGLTVLQYTDSRFVTCVYNGVNYCEQHGMQVGEYLMSLYAFPSERYWLWCCIAFLAGTYVFFMALSCVVLEYWRYESPDNIALDDLESKDGGDSTASTNDDYGLVKTPRNAPTINAERDNQVEVEVPVTRSAQKGFIPVTVAFKNLWYSVPNPAQPKASIDLLKGISGYALPGSMTALMGSSGAGKTTLMDVIAGRKTGGKIQGEILLNGHPATDLVIRRATGYCEQMDIHSEAATIREALTFSSFLRQDSSISDAKKYDSVSECIELLGLEDIADQIIRGSSVEQMKRLTIGVELAAQPSVIFLDEPTSGLDARSAKLIMDGVRKVADTGRTIVCTIHQPSAAVFRVFDNLLLLKRGGETVFFGDLGEKAINLVNYFESIEGVAPMEEECNPATWMLEVIGAGVGNNIADTTDFVALFKGSKHFQQLQAKLDQDGVSKPSPFLPALNFGDKRAASNATQAKFLVKRFFDLYWRTASYNLTRFAISLIVGVLFAITYVGTDFTSYQGINSGMGMVFMTNSYVTFIAFNSAAPICNQERASFYRERAAQTYSAFWYFVGATVVEIPYSFMSTLLYVGIFLPSAGFTGTTQFFSYWFNQSLLILMQTYFGQFLAYLLPSLDVTLVCIFLLNTLCIFFQGFNPPASTIPSGYHWLYTIVPHRYTYGSLTGILFSECEAGGDRSQLGCQELSGTPPTLADGITIKEYMEVVFKVEHSEIWSNSAIVVLWIVCLRVLALLTLRYVNHQKK